jgi:hypothetical protein
MGMEMGTRAGVSYSDHGLLLLPLVLRWALARYDEKNFSQIFTD